MKPILFNTQMVQAILDGRKTQTRRIVKAPVLYRADTPPDVIAKAQLPKGYWDFVWHGKAVGSFTIQPRYQPGDVLYVRETWCKVPGLPPYLYKASSYDGIDRKWRPSIHMPKEAARLFMRVTDVRVERLKSMSSDDGFCEGFTDWDDFVRVWNSTIKKADLDRYGWDANPFVWVISFERCGKEGEPWNG